ncbi:CHAT domain-containing protein [Kitasatospora acidiphila]|uniref:CHAT domain-containing protein n=1 Tax=Kitasatospora acidiphila TaxID=2567942 RepID=UPI003C7571FA
MGEPERRVAALLMRASTVQQAEYVLFADAAEFDPDELVRELQVRQRAFAADGQAKAAALVDFYVSLVRELRPALLAAVARRHEEPDDTWQATERQASELLKQGRLDAAHDLVRAALRSVRTGSYANGRFLGIQVLIAKAMHAAGRSRGALEILDSLELGPASGRGDVAVDAMLRARLHQLRGGMYQAEAQYERARSEYASALELLQQVGSVDEELTIRLELADAQLAAGRSRDAVREYRRVLTRAESKGVAGEPLARVLNRLGEAYRKAGDAAAARSCHRRALELTDDAEVDEPRTLRAAEAWVGLGDLAADAGNGSEAAEAYFQALTKSMTVNRDATAHGMHLVASRVGRLAVPDADLLFRTAQIFRDMFSDPERYWSHHLPFRLAEAAQQGAGGDIDGSIAALRTLRGECLRRPSELKIGMEIDDRLAQALLVRGSRADRQGAFDLAWQRRSELLRSIAHRAHRANGDVPSLVVQYRASYELLVRSLLDHGREIEIPAEDRPGTAAEQDEAVELAFNLHEEYKAWVDLTLNPAGTLSTPATLHGLRDCLAADPDAENCAYVSYFCGTNATTIFVLHADTGRVTFFRTELTEATVKRTAECLRRVFDGDAGAFPPLPPLPARRPWRRGLDFFDQLAPDLLAFLPAVGRRELLCIAAEPTLTALPLSALPLPAAVDHARGNAQVLAQRHAVVQVSSATALLRTAGRPSAPGSGGVFVAGVAAREDADADRLERDIDFIAPGRSGAGTSEASGPAATRETVLAGLGAARVAHLTGHGWYDRIEPLDSGLFLAHDGQRPSKYPLTVEIRTRLRHLLTARHVLDAGLGMELLTLRACSTARRDLHSTGDIQGLAQLLQSSGARTVVGTLWDVDDDSSRRLFEDFYRRRAEEPQAPWKALWLAQRSMLEDPVVPWESHPYHWAALALFGHWRSR